MVEHYTKAVVLARDPRGELDAAITLYTKDFGKVVAKAKSIRRFTSKLSGHLTPGSLTKIRIVERNGAGHQVVDALSTRVEVTEALLRFLSFINQLAPVNMPDLQLWHELEAILENSLVDKTTYRHIIGVLGYDTDEATCNNCNSKKIAYFAPRDIMFLCDSCFKGFSFKTNEIFSI